MHTGWASLALAAAGRNPLDVRRGRRDPVAYLVARPGQTRDLGAVARTSLVLSAAVRSLSSYGLRDLVAELVAAQGDDGAFEGRVNTTSFAVLALRAAGRGVDDPAVQRAGRWIASEANPDGGFSFAGRGGPSGADDTATALQALAAAGQRRSETVARAVAWLEARQNRDGGFGLSRGAPSNAQSTAFAVQGLLAAGREPRRVRRGRGPDPIAYLRALVQRDGTVRYSRMSAQTPVWVTAQAVLALERKPFPLGVVRRAAARPRAAVAAGSRAAPRGGAQAAAAEQGPAPERAPRQPRAGTTTAPRATASQPAPDLRAHARLAGRLLAQLL